MAVAQSKIQTVIKSIPSLNIVPNERTVCVYNTIGQKICYQISRENEIQCDPSVCKISFQSPNQGYLGKTFPKGINIGLRPRGAFASVHVFGMFPKSELSAVSSVLEDPVAVKDVEKIQNPTFDLPTPPKKCRWAVWADECRPYLESITWNYNLFRGWKKLPSEEDPN